MDPARNPYTPGAGTPPLELAGREEIVEQARITLDRIAGNRPGRSVLLLGLRGVGKTVLLNRVRQLVIRYLNQYRALGTARADEGR